MATADVTSPVACTFSQYFELILGTDQQIVERAQRLRYEVYCREFGFEREEDCPGGLERDEYDQQAYHCLIRHLPTGTMAGCLRLVHLDQPQARSELPIQRHGGAALVGATLHPGTLPASQLCEISRIAVSASFRRRASEAQTPIGNVDRAVQEARELRSFPLLAVALFMAARVMVLMEPRLARMLVRSGLRFQRLGPVIDYHGQRAAYYLHYAPQDHQASLTLLRSDMLALFAAVKTQLTPQLPPPAARP
jgi:N-acyl amino acid synthase of PEP-CTERM/exosortase system